MDSQTMLKKISLYLIMAIGILSVLFIAPITDSFIEHSKFYTLIFGTLAVLVMFVVKSFKDGALRITVSPMSGALVLFMLATIASTFFTSDYPVEGLLGFGGVFLAVSVLSLIGGSVLPKNLTLKFLYTLTATSIALIVISFLQIIGFGPAQLLNQLFNLSLPTTMLFNVAGSSFIALQVVGLTLIAVLTHVASTKKLNKVFAVALPILLIGAGLFAWSLLPGKITSLSLPSFQSSWSVMLDTLKAPKSALIGAGISSYKNAYLIFKPIWVNGSNNWAVNYTQASNMPITLVTTMGILGFLSWILLIVKAFQFHKKSTVESKALGIFLMASFFLNLVLPFNTILLTLQAIAIACLTSNEKNRLPLLQMQAFKFNMLNKPTLLNATRKTTNLPLYIGTGLSLLVILAIGYLTTRSVQAHMLMSQSSQAVASNNILQAYELQQKAVALNPYYDVFRRRYSATSALIAIALSNKADITESEKQQVSQLLQQSVTEARAATTLDQTDSQNWANLAQIYNNLIGVSEDAVNWTIQSYVSAIETNPNDPLLRLELASVFVGQEAYQQALSIYDQAINIKADLPISHYRRGEMLELVATPEALREARLSYQRALVLLEPDSEDYLAVNTKIADLEAYMEENDISLEPETEEEVLESGEGTPTITEQNLNNTDTVTPSDEPVELNTLPLTDDTASPSATQQEN
jgi:tetratricopeptide (TPR) repeat protein